MQRSMLLLILSLAVGPIHAALRRNIGHKEAPGGANALDDAPPAWDGNMQCIPQTGMRCFNGPSDCAPYVNCTESKYCVCHAWGCADAQGVCRPVHNQFVDPTVRISPEAEPHRSLTMKADGATPPGLADGYPGGADTESQWTFLLQPDNKTVLVTTRLNAHQTNNLTLAYAAFLNLPIPTPPKEEKPHILAMASERLAPVQMRPQNARDAAFTIVKRSGGRYALQHVATGQLLAYDKHSGKLTVCQKAPCPAGVSCHFDFWPKLFDRHAFFVAQDFANTTESSPSDIAASISVAAHDPKRS